MMDTIFLWVAALSYVLAAVTLAQRKFYPLVTYLASMAIFYVFSRMSIYLQLIGAVAVAVGASNLARFPISLEWPAKEKATHTSLLSLSILLTIVLFTVSDTLVLRFVHGYGLVAALLTAAYIFYAGTSPTIKSKSMNIASILLLCSIPHFLLATSLLASLSIPLVGNITFGLPMIIALLSPFSFILALHMTH
ncbi:hypothetical protein A3A21_03725 [Candidatus Jorgensenbacteria bacterium RIFCSPLOWO2_01_FULL_45_25b]|uniref:Uncharacterized protein n=1 Tax=Candidatus Jorgensenbacteria bacterium RIFCSPLOWO2_01_FULL_45_25b TaxID=1798471 RepID=A0A1F6BWC1_9BACT|nr:MAG: hypothetical protein A3A21_03725 [Candidatus Jorgensenbacteria bacterium RIFCSPLOWO2_01_FULL_45_25b]HLD33958.1 hypothetical protein [Candidatus Nanoarchaeia archaeon]